MNKHFKTKWCWEEKKKSKQKKIKAPLRCECVNLDEISADTHSVPEKKTFLFVGRQAENHLRIWYDAVYTFFPLQRGEKWVVNTQSFLPATLSATETSPNPATATWFFRKLLSWPESHTLMYLTAFKYKYHQNKHKCWSICISSTRQELLANLIEEHWQPKKKKSKPDLLQLLFQQQVVGLIQTWEEKKERGSHHIPHCRMTSRRAEKPSTPQQGFVLTVHQKCLLDGLGFRAKGL